MALAVVVVLLAPVVYSYTTTMMRPSSLPLWPRSVEWLRAHHGNWIVDEVEHYYYSWKAPGKGGPQLRSLPKVGISVTSGNRHSALSPPRITPLFDHPLAGEGIRPAVIARMHQGPVEAPGQIGRRHLPIVAARDHQPIKALGVPAPHPDLPRVPCEPYALHRSAEADVTPQALCGRV